MKKLILATLMLHLSGNPAQAQSPTQAALASPGLSLESFLKQIEAEKLAFDGQMAQYNQFKAALDADLQRAQTMNQRVGAWLQSIGPQAAQIVRDPAQLAAVKAQHAAIAQDFGPFCQIEAWPRLAAQFAQHAQGFQVLEMRVKQAASQVYMLPTQSQAVAHVEGILQRLNGFVRQLQGTQQNYQRLMQVPSQCYAYAQLETVLDLAASAASILPDHAQKTGLGALMQEIRSEEQLAAVQQTVATLLSGMEAQILKENTELLRQRERSLRNQLNVLERVILASVFAEDLQKEQTQAHVNRVRDRLDQLLEEAKAIQQTSIDPQTIPIVLAGRSRS